MYGLYKLVGEFLGCNANDPEIGMSIDDPVSNGMHQVCFAKANSPINEKRVVRRPWLICNCDCCIESEIVVLSNNETLKGISRLKIAGASAPRDSRLCLNYFFCTYIVFCFPRGDLRGNVMIDSFRLRLYGQFYRHSQKG